MLSTEQASIIKGLLARGEKQHDIAAFFSVNGGRIAEIKTGARFADVKPAPRKDLPSPADMAGHYVVHRARAAIRRAQMGLQAAQSFLDDYERDNPNTGRGRIL